MYDYSFGTDTLTLLTNHLISIACKCTAARGESLRCGRLVDNYRTTLHHKLRLEFTKQELEQLGALLLKDDCSQEERLLSQEEDKLLQRVIRLIPSIPGTNLKKLSEYLD